MKKLWVLVVMTVFLLAGFEKSFGESIFVKEDATLLMKNEILNTKPIEELLGKHLDEEELYEKHLSKKEFYSKSPGKEKIKIASNAREDVIYFNEFYFFVDNYNTLQMVSKDGTKQKIASNIINGEFNYNYKSTFLYKAYGVSNDCKSIVYVNDDLELYYYRDGESEKIASDIYGFVLSDIGDNIYYIDNSNNLYLYKDGENEKIASNVTRDIKITSSGNMVAWKNIYNELYVKSLKDPNKQKIYSSKSKYWLDMIMLDEESILYLAYYRKPGELYIYSKGEKKKVVSDVVDFECDKNNNKIYYVNGKSELYEVDMKNFDNKNKISSSVDRIIGIDVNNGKLYYSDEDYNNFCKDSGKEAKKLENYSVYNKSDGRIYLLDRSTLNKILSEVKKYAFNSACIVYVDQDNKLHVYDVNSKTDSVEIENYRKYSSLYLGDECFYERLLEPGDIEGYWKAYSYIYEINYKTGVKFSGNKKLVKFNGNNMSVYKGENVFDEYIYTVYDSTSSTMDIEINCGMRTPFVTLSPDGNHMIIEENGETTYLERISEEEFNKIANL